MPTKFRFSRTGVWTSLFRILWEFLTLLQVAKKIKILTCVAEIEFQSSRRQPVALLPRIITFPLGSNYWVKMKTACNMVQTQAAEGKTLLTGDQVLTIQRVYQVTYSISSAKCLCQSALMCPSNFLEFYFSNLNRCNNTGTRSSRI